MAKPETQIALYLAAETVDTRLPAKRDELPSRVWPVLESERRLPARSGACAGFFAVEFQRRVGLEKLVVRSRPDGRSMNWRRQAVRSYGGMEFDLASG